MSDHLDYYTLSPAQLERIALLAEEAAEVSHIAMKVVRHGYLSQHPVYSGYDNRAQLLKELGDFVGALNILVKSKDLGPEQEVRQTLENTAKDKLWNVTPYFHCPENVEHAVQLRGE